VDHAYDKLSETLGKNWQRNYIVWDMCCGVGNLEVKHSNARNIFMSTLDKEDIDVMKATKTCVAAERFQYDYLNDDITEEGNIDYSLTNKVPIALQEAIKAGKKILILINPPYAEASSSDNAARGGGESKTGVSITKINKMLTEYGYAKRELFAQFLARISREMPNATIAIFSTLKYINASNFEKFREHWNAQYMGGFIVHSKSFDGLKGNFPIGFLVWKTLNGAKDAKQIITEIETEVINKDAEPIGSKVFYDISSDNFLNTWLPRYKTDTQNIPLKNAVHPQYGKAKVSSWIKDAIGYFWCNGNDLQQSGQTAIFSSVFSAGNGFYILKNDLWKVAVMFTVRQITPHTWINHNDQFLIPKTDLSEEFKIDCLIYMLFHGKNLTAGADNLDWDNKSWDLVNHFIPFSESEVNATERFKSDFMVNFLSKKKLSVEAKEVLNSGKSLWQAYFAHTDPHSIREELQLNCSDVGWYQIRKALEARNSSGDFTPVNFQPFKDSYARLTEKLLPQVYEYQFLKS
jgi:hypothetical protein